ncbi:hypothetical protein QL093DRAFT_1105166 [Fusarium oxysporum]|nr:hypothetical protein FOWG_18222 [Fusarium oxysporum f. sp. lycopersici MN25]KAJ9413527.1 hypothetical protein QL093DRAFT_1105166 [Fusarium oxysporum]
MAQFQSTSRRHPPDEASGRVLQRKTLLYPSQHTPHQSLNGQGASMLTTIDRKALLHHCEICCIKNMRAESPAWVRLALLPSSMLWKLGPPLLSH